MMFFFFMAVKQDVYYAVIEVLTKTSQNGIRQNREFEVWKHRLKISDKLFWYRTAKLITIMLRHTTIGLKQKLKEMYSQFFNRSHKMFARVCRILCSCTLNTTTTTVAESNLGKGGRGFWKTSEPPQF